jgi:hypothetical protein
MPAESEGEIAAELIAIGHNAIQDCLLHIAEEVRHTTINNIPVGDPDLDPDPNYALKDHVVIRLYGNFVSITVEGLYALKQHENQSFEHPRGGEPKFLERAVASILPSISPQLAATLQREFSDVRGGRTRRREPLIVDVSVK